MVSREVALWVSARAASSEGLTGDEGSTPKLPPVTAGYW